MDHDSSSREEASMRDLKLKNGIKQNPLTNNKNRQA
jgi:hypothetical protein